jgi:predicted nucleic acid-binding protein
MVLCDTNILIHFFANRTDTVERMKRIGTQNVLLSAITVAELYQGMGNKKELQSMKKNIKFYDVIHIDTRISEKMTALIHDYKLSHGLTIPDALIAATALVYNIPLFTYNTRDFAFIPNILLYE